MSEEKNSVLPFTRTTLTDSDKMWLKALNPEDRESGLAFIHWKKTKGSIDKLSRPRIFMEAFQIAMALRIVQENSVNTENNPKDSA